MGRSPFDGLMTLLAWKDPQAMVSFLLEGVVVYEGEVCEEEMECEDEETFEDEEAFEGEFTLNDLFVESARMEEGILCYVRWNGEPIVLHAEFCIYPDSKLPWRVWQYNTLVSIITGRPVYSVVVYLVQAPSIPEPVYKKHFQNGQVACSLSFHEIKLWELEPEVLKEKPAILLPLLLLMKNGQKRETVARMIDGLARARVEIDVLYLAIEVAKQVLTSKEDQEWFQERDRLSSERFRYLMAQEKELEKGRKGTLLHEVEIRFPTLLVRAKQIVEGETWFGQMRVMLDKLYRANTVEEAEAALLDNG